MKRVATWILWFAFVITMIAHAIIGIKLLDNNYEFIVEAYIGAAGFFTMFVCILIKAFGNKCPHCGKMLRDNGEYCSHCGKKIKE
ncbi:MAG: zinc ribbon domain-containing protein [Clostridia bacterium]|nr:zinc ribbon domain-containing protein [Clostridia bacterium]